ncbi:hypothetical protein C7B61_09675 [filamentous cyanobacterium CCP1]|nr:hypothetical protein C7B61_09675 [filamentous cyanobacterium CCP1]
MMKPPGRMILLQQGGTRLPNWFPIEEWKVLRLVRHLCGHFFFWLTHWNDDLLRHRTTGASINVFYLTDATNKLDFLLPTDDGADGSHTHDVTRRVAIEAVEAQLAWISWEVPIGLTVHKDCLNKCDKCANSSKLGHKNENTVSESWTHIGNLGLSFLWN